MAVGILSGFTPTLIATTADTEVTPCYYFVARISAAAANAATASFFNGTTAAANKICELSAIAASADETGIPYRCKSGTLKVQVSRADAEVTVGVR